MSDAIQAKIQDIDEEIARTQVNKRTMSHLCLLRSRRAELTRQMMQLSKKSGGGQFDGFSIQKTGKPRISLVGSPSVGKSSLMNIFMGDEEFSEVNERQFTTLTAIPGTVDLGEDIPTKGAGATKVQIVDLPGIIDGAIQLNRGGGRQILSTARTSDLVLILLDGTRPWGEKKMIERELHQFGIRLNKKPKHIIVRKLSSGGIRYRSTCRLTKISKEEVESACKQFKFNSVDILFREDANMEDLLDALHNTQSPGFIVYIPCVYALNKIDMLSLQEVNLWNKFENMCPISVKQGWNIDELKEMMWERLDLIRVYTKPRSSDPDFEDPVILRRDKSTVEDFCMKIHKTLAQNMRYAWVWGRSVKFSPGRAGLSHNLADEDVVHIVAKI
ncbi:hypothetical protein PCE1_001166 [Barthelona sp. PCE]